MTTELRPSTDGVRDCELCIVGAGYAALNGLNAAAKYLKKGDRVVLVDKNQTWGGQWTHQYDFVRLHQPYRMFTAGDQPWTLRRDPSYLATRREVLDHLASVPAISAGHLDVTPVFGHAYRGHRVRDGHVEIDATPAANGQSTSGTIRIRARRLLKATGSEIEPLPPFSLSSTRVRSVGVSDPVLMTPEFLDNDSPVYVIGSGKTAMDCVRYVLESRRSRRQLNILIGSGMWFFVRNNFYPLAGPRLPLSIVSKFEGNFNRWYPVPRRLPMIARIMMTRREVLRRAERLLKTRFSDPPASAPARPTEPGVTAYGLS